jgi:Uma2 family endonuclease
VGKLLLDEPDYPAPGEFPTDLPYSYGEPLETPWHVAQGSLLCEVIAPEFEDLDDVAMCVNIALHFSVTRARNKDFVGPDFFIAFGPKKTKDRNYYAIWEEGGKYPDLIVEFLSPSTQENDRGEKFELYRDRFKTKEYFWIDPVTRAITGFRRIDGEYVPIEPDASGRLWSEVLQLSFGNWSGRYQHYTMKFVRMFRADGTMLPTGEERAARNATDALRAERKATAVQNSLSQQILRTESEARRAEAEARRAEAEARRAEAEAARALAAEAELAALRAQLTRLQSNPPASDSP